ncbi:FBB13 [Auxenochlorella protothecoides x Auxenochlorella symbiontica]
MPAPVPSCDRVFRALEDCSRKHPRQPEVCSQLSAAAGWCAVRSVCPSEVDAVEACAGRGPGMTPPRVPHTCSFQVQCLDECLEAHAERLEADAELPRVSRGQGRNPA